jgi:hypothetical protein
MSGGIFCTLNISYALCDPISTSASIFIKNDFYGIAFEHPDLVELHFSREVGEDFFAVVEG